MTPRTIDGAHIDDLAGFYDEVTRSLFDGASWGRNLDAFEELLDEGLEVRWLDAERSRTRLGYAETARWLEARLYRVAEENRHEWQERLTAARQGEGETLFEVLVRLMRERGVQLELA